MPSGLISCNLSLVAPDSGAPHPRHPRRRAEKPLGAEALPQPELRAAERSEPFAQRPGKGGPSDSHGGIPEAWEGLRWLGMAGMAGMGWKGGWCMGHGAFLGWVHRRWSVFMR